MNHDKLPSPDEILIAITIAILTMAVIALGVLLFNEDYNIFMFSAISILLITFSCVLRYLIKHQDK